MISGLLYALLRPVLPRGRAGGLALGALLLALIATRIDPLRGDNIDFAIVGPPWLAVAGFGAVALLQGLLTAALAERKLRWRPAPVARAVTIGRVALGVLVLVALPSFVDAIDQILSAG